MTQTKIIITGATGFIGSHVAEYFASMGIIPYCFVRNEAKTEHLKNCNIIKGDILDFDSLKEAFKNAEFIIHTAGLSSDWGKKKNFHESNVTGTLNVLKAAVENNIKDVIITGSISSYGEENCLRTKNENTPHNSHYPYFLDSVFPCAMNFYRDSKAELTKKSISFATKHDLNLTIIEPVWVFGEREFNTGFYEYMKTVNAGTPFLFGSKKNKFPVIYAGDLARFYYLAWQKRLSGINTIIASNPKAYTMDHIYSLFCKELGKKKPKNLPKFIIYPIGFLLELFYTLFGISSPPLLTRARVNMFYDNVEIDSAKAARLLGYTSEFSLEECIKRTVKWYKENGYL